MHSQDKRSVWQPAAYRGEHRGPSVAVETRGRLVDQQDVRLCGESAGDVEAALFATG